MKQQLIAVILGTDQVGILSDIATLVSESECNILDSRHAIYGQEFSLTMIIEGSHTAITRVELSIPELCQRRFCRGTQPQNKCVTRAATPGW